MRRTEYRGGLLRRGGGVLMIGGNRRRALRPWFRLMEEDSGGPA